MSPFIADPPLRFGAIPRSFINDDSRPFRNSVGQWLLVAGPRSIHSLMTLTVVSLAEEETVRVVDAGGQLDDRLVEQVGAENIVPLRARIRLKRPASCFELLALIERETSTAVPFILLDLLRPFYDGSIALRRREEVLRRCFANLRRLQLSTSGIVSVCPPGGHYPKAKELFALVEAEARQTFDKELLLPGLEMQRML